MTQIETETLRVERTFAAPPDKVRAAWLTPDLMARWFAPGPMKAEVHSLDGRVGGQYEISMHGEEDGKPVTHTCSGVFSVVDEDRIVMSFNWTEEPLPNETTMTVEFHAQDGGTRLVLIHEGFPTVQARDMHQQGWEGCLANLPRAL